MIYENNEGNTMTGRLPRSKKEDEFIVKKLFAAMLDEIRTYLPKLQRLSRILSEIDCYGALAEVSSANRYIRPEFTDGELDIVNGRHPILDELMKDPRYVANSVKMNEEKCNYNGNNSGENYSRNIFY